MYCETCDNWQSYGDPDPCPRCEAIKEKLGEDVYQYIVDVARKAAEKEVGDHNQRYKHESDYY